jgi:hypothetical protein
MAAALLAAAAPARAQPSSPTEDERLDPVRASLEASLRAAEKEGLPSDMLLHKVREGLAKQVPPQRIAAAVQGLLGTLRTADRLLAPVPPHPQVSRPELVRLTAEALVAGASAGQLEQLVGAIVRSDRGQAAPLVRDGIGVVAELVERGVDGQVAAEGARTAFQRHGARGWRAVLRAVRVLGPTSTEAERARTVRRAADGGPGAPGWDSVPGAAKGQGRSKAR